MANNYHKHSGSTDDDNHYIFTDPFKAKDLMWESYYGFIKHYNDYRMYYNMSKSHPIILGGLVKYGIFFYGEIRDFLKTIYNKDKEKLLEVDRLNKIFSTEKVLFNSHENIVFVRNFFGSFMIDSGVKKLIHIKDERKPIEKFLSDKYSDIEDGGLKK